MDMKTNETVTVTAEQARLNQRARRRERLLRTRAGINDALAIPNVPDALADGLLPIDVLESDLLVEIPNYGTLTFPVNIDDEVTLLCNGEIVDGPYQVVDPTTQVFPIDLHVPKDKLQSDGTYKLSYRVEGISGRDALSEDYSARVNTALPPVGDALVFDDEVETGGITRDYLDTHGQVDATAHYAPMEVGQRVVFFWNTTEIGSVPVEQTDVDNAEVTVSYPDSFLEQQLDGPHITNYRIYSRAGVRGSLSENKTVGLLLDPPDNLQLPYVPLHDDGVIDREDADFGVTVEVNYDNPKTGDQIVVDWGGQALSAVPVADPDAVPVAIIDVPRQRLFAAGDGAKQVLYSVRRAGFPTPSPTETINVDLTGPGPVDPDPTDPENGALVRPKVQGAVSLTDNVIRPEDKDQPATATVPWYDEAIEDEIITLYWGNRERVAATHTITAADIIAAADFELEVPWSVIADGKNNPALSLFYTLSNPDDGTSLPNPVLSPSATVDVQVADLSDALLTPTFTDVQPSGWLWREDVIDGCRINIEFSGDWKVGDTVDFTWIANDAYNAGGNDIPRSEYEDLDRAITLADLTNGMDFVVPWTSVQPIEEESPSLYGAGIVHYTVTQNGTEYGGGTNTRATVKIDLRVV